MRPPHGAQSRGQSGQAQEYGVVCERKVCRCMRLCGEYCSVQPPTERDPSLPRRQFAAPHQIHVSMATCFIVQRDAVVVAPRQGGAHDEAPANTMSPCPLTPEGAAKPRAHIEVLGAAHNADQEQRRIHRRPRRCVTICGVRCFSKAESATQPLVAVWSIRTGHWQASSLSRHTLLPRAPARHCRCRSGQHFDGWPGIMDAGVRPERDDDDQERRCQCRALNQHPVHDWSGAQFLPIAGLAVHDTLEATKLR